MKLNFATLANQLKNNTPQKQEADNSSQLNYYRRSNGQEETNKNVKQRKSQLQKEEESAIIMGSSILTDYFSTPQVKEEQQKITTPRINLSVMYPYEVSTSIDPNNVDDHIEDMKEKGILDESAMKFIKRQIAKDLSKSKEKNKKESSKKLNSFNESIYLEGESIKTPVSNINEDFLNETQEIFISENSLSINPSTKNILFKNFSKETLPNQQQKKNSLMTSTTIESLYKKNTNVPLHNKTKNYMKPIHEIERKVSKKASKQELTSTQTLKEEEELKELKPKPSLELTKSSPFTYKIQAQRESKYKHKKTNVFNELYNEAYVRECMRSLERESIEKDIDERRNFTKTLRTEKSQKYKVNESFMERLERSIEKKYYKEYLINKYSVDERTGQPYFKPDMTLSKQTYENLFHRSLEKLRSESFKSIGREELTEQNIKGSKKSINQTKTESIKQISVSYKSAARTKENSIEKLSCSVEKVDENRKNGEKSIRIDQKSIKIVEKINEKIIDRIVSIFYPTQVERSEEDFYRTEESISLLSEHEYVILSSLFDQIETLQESTKVSALMFKSLLQQFFNRLNYYDQLTLREGVMKKKEKPKKEIIEYKNQENGKLTKEINKHKKSHYPRINIISSSMEKLNPKYDQALYYV